MADRSIVTRIRAEASQFLSTMDKVKRATSDVGDAADKSTKRADSAFSRMSRSFRENQEQWDKVGNSALIAGGAMAAGLGLATKAAISWESAFAGVRKTVDDTAEGYAQLEDDLLGLATVLPATQEEIAGVAEAAGQLGISRDSIVDFTKTMIDLGESTNLSAEEAATGLARFANVMGTSQDDFDRLGSSIVGLGNNFATTEREILEMSSRLSGAGRQAGLTEGDVLGIATALSSVGIEAEAGGTAFSRVMIEIGKSVDTNSDKLATFARVAGMSVESFQSLWDENSGEALQAFISGLGEVQARGESLEPILAELGMTDIRVGDALRRAASSADVFSDAMNRGNDEFEANIALQEEAEKRYETTESKLRIARNSLTNAAIDLGSVLGPVLADVAELAASAADAFVKLPEPVQQSAAYIGTFGAAGLLAFGGAVKVTRSVQDLSEAMSALSKSSPAAAAGLGKVGKAAGGALVLGGVAIAINEISDAFARNAVKDAEDLAGALTDLAEGAERVPDLGDIFENQNALPLFRKDIETTEEAMEAFGLSARLALGGNWADKLERFLGNGSLAKFEEQVSQIDAALAEMVEGGRADEAARVVERLTEAAEAQGVPVERILELLPEYSSATDAAASAAKSWSGELATVEQTADDAQATIDDLADSIRALGEQTVDAREAEAEFYEAVREATAAVEENGATLDLSTEKGKANNEALSNLRAATLDQAAATYSLTGSIEQATEKVEIGRQAFVDAAVQMGLTQAEAEDLADAYGLIPEDVSTYVEVRGTQTARNAVLDVITALNRVTNKTVTVRVATDTSSLGRVYAGLPVSYADGGIQQFDKTIGQHRPGIYPVTRRGILMAEEGAGPWEAFISGHPGKRARSRMIADETVSRLGGEIVWHKFADGGIFGAGMGRDFGPSPRSEDNSVHFHGDIHARDLRATIDQADSYKRARRAT